MRFYHNDDGSQQRYRDRAYTYFFEPKEERFVREQFFPEVCKALDFPDMAWPKGFEAAVAWAEAQTKVARSGEWELWLVPPPASRNLGRSVEAWFCLGGFAWVKIEHRPGEWYMKVEQSHEFALREAVRSFNDRLGIRHPYIQTDFVLEAA